MELKTRLTKDVYTEFVEYAGNNIPYYEKILKRNLYAGVIAGSVIFLAFGILQLIDGDTTMAIVYFVLTVLFFLTFPRFKFIKRSQIKSLVRSNYNRQVKADIVDPNNDIIVNIKEDGITYEDRGNSSSCSWEAVYRVCKSKNLIIIFVTQASGVTIEKEAFDSEEAFNLCFETCEQFKYEVYMKNKEQNQN